MSPAPNGVVLEDRGRIETVFVDRRVALRDGCASLSATVLDDGARPAVVLRERTYGFRDLRQRTTEFSNRYQLMIDPGKRKLSLSRAMDLRRTKLVVKKKHPAVAPLGQPNVIELRAHGPTLEAWINGERVATVHDPEYGFGCAGFLVNYGYDNACSVIQFTAWDPVDVSLLFRLHVEGSRSDRSVTGYELRIAPAFRAFSLRLTHWEEEDDDDDDPDEPEQKDLYYELTPFETTTIAGPGKPMQVEARYADSVLRLLVGDQIVSTVIDPSFGYGRTAWRVRSVRDDGPARVTIRAAGLFTTR